MIPASSSRFRVAGSLLAISGLGACDGAGSRSDDAEATFRAAIEAESGVEQARPSPPPRESRRGEAPEAQVRAVYVPVYSHIYFGDAPSTFDLTVTLSVRNADPADSLVVTAVRYLDSGGDLVREYVREPVRLGPMASADFVVGERDRTGGIGANFVVEWAGPGPRTEPVIEAVMIGTRGGQGISFTSVARPIRAPPAP